MIENNDIQQNHRSIKYHLLYLSRFFHASVFNNRVIEVFKKCLINVFISPQRASIYGSHYIKCHRVRVENIFAYENIPIDRSYATSTYFFQIFAFCLAASRDARERKPGKYASPRGCVCIRLDFDFTIQFHLVIQPSLRKQT